MTRSPVMRFVKGLANLIALILVFPCAITSWLEARLHPTSEDVFRFWTNVFAIVPGGPGAYLRRAFYHLTLSQCSLNCWIGFGSLFSHRQAHVEDEVYIGPYAVVGSARLETGCLIGTRVSLLSGQAQHELGQDGRWAPSDAARFREITVGSHAWIGEAAVVMADVGAGAQVAAGSVVSAPVPPRIVVAGNPARFVREAHVAAAMPEQPHTAPLARTAQVGFVDWLKCLGMFVIVYGHVAAWAPFATLPPIYAKQLGVAFFVFVTGYSLSKETRDRKRVVFNRLFEVYFFAGTLAILMSVVTYLSGGGVQLSNYAPLMGGANVLFDFFPANPTTWYLGTYLHLIVLWALLLHRLRASAWLLAGSFVIEVLVRAFVMEAAGRYVAYMVFFNWSTVFLLGFWYGQRPIEQRLAVSDYSAVGAALALATVVITWSTLAISSPFEWTFPLMRLSGSTPSALLLTSAAVSTAYTGMTWLAFKTLAPLSAPRLVRFVARNTLIIFLAHMPVIFALLPLLRRWTADRSVQSLVLMIVCMPGLALVSEAIRRSVQPRRLRDEVYHRLSEWGQPMASPRRAS